MRIACNDYADFVAIVSVMGGVECVAYRDQSPNSFLVIAALSGGTAVQHTMQNPGSKPVNFDVDFPNAVSCVGSISSQ